MMMTSSDDVASSISMTEEFDDVAKNISCSGTNDVAFSLMWQYSI